jgi:hypothetical protein
MPFVSSLLAPVFSAVNITDVRANQNLFSDLSRNMSLQNFQDNATSSGNSNSTTTSDTAGSDVGLPQTDNSTTTGNDQGLPQSDNSTDIPPEPGPSSD